MPVSYLGDLRRQIEVAQNLTLTEQRDILYRIKPRLKDPESSDDAQELLRLLRAREDLLATVAEEIDALSTGGPRAKPEKAASHAYDAPLPVPPGVLDLYRDNGALESLVNSVAATSEGWTLQAGEDKVSIYAEHGELVLAAVFLRWTEKESKRFMAMGWESNDRIIKSAAAVLGIATYGLGFGLLLHKGARDFVKKNLLVKRFALSAQADVAPNVLEAFRILESDITAIKVSRLVAPPKKFSLWPH